MSRYNSLMAMCQRGYPLTKTGAEHANNALATCYSAIGSLIAENERLESEAVYSAAGFDAVREEIVRLKAENERLKADHDLLISNALPREFLKVRADYYQLRAELKGLRTGFDAQNEAIARLKKECKGAELYRQVERGAHELPEGWEVRICIEKDSGYVELFDEDGCEIDFPNSCETLWLTVSEAIDAAMGKGGE